MSDVRERLVLPFIVPIGAVLTIAILVFAFSRVLLSVPKEMAVAVALMVALNILIVCAVAAVRKPFRAVDILPLMAVAAVPLFMGLAVSVGMVDVTETEGKHVTKTAVVEIAAANLAFDSNEMRLTEGAETVIKFSNREALPHNLAIYADQAMTQKIFGTEPFTGPGSRDYKLKAPVAGTYFFRCDIHPTMMGTVVVEKSGDGGEAESGGAGSAVKVVIEAKLLLFSQTLLTLPAETESTIEFKNSDNQLHNISIYADQAMTQALFKGDFFTGPATREYKFKTPGKGTYYFRCDVHPTTMAGKLETV